MFLVPFQKKGLENRSSRFEPQNSWLSFSICSVPPFSHTPTVLVSTISRFQYNFFQICPPIFCQHTIHQVIWPSPGTLTRTRIFTKNIMNTKTSHQYYARPDEVVPPHATSRRRHACQRVSVVMNMSIFFVMSQTVRLFLFLSVTFHYAHLA